jgi:L-lysine cyclodeaminase
MYFFSESEIAKVITDFGPDAVMDRLIDGVRTGFLAMGNGTISHVARAGFSRDRNLIEWMPVSTHEGSAIIKIVSYCPKNPIEVNLPTICALIVEVDPARGQIQTVAEGWLLTAMRTGAASAVASELLAMPNSSTLGLIGCGCQAVTQAHALSRVFPLRRILSHDIDPHASEGLRRRLGFLGVAIEVATPEEIEVSADIICTATTAEVGAPPVLEGRKLRPHVHINAVGSDFHGKVELPRSLVRSAFVAADCLDQAGLEGECQHFSADELRNGRAIPLESLISRPADYIHLRDRLTIFDSTGIAMQDAVALKTFLDLAAELKLESNLIGNGTKNNPQDPYGSLTFCAGHGHNLRRA